MAESIAKLGTGTPIQDMIGATAESPASVFKESLFSVENDATSET